MSGLANVPDCLGRALSDRVPLAERLAGEDTDCYRLWHGSQEGAPGVTLDRYADLALLQSFHSPLANETQAEVQAILEESLPGLELVYNDRSAPGSRVRNRDADGEAAAAEREHIVSEHGVGYKLKARHRGNDPWLFLDLRPTRRAVMNEATGKSLLNLFAYTCGVGVAAAVAGARRVLNIDFSESCLEVGSENATLNAVSARSSQVHSDVFPALKQLAGIRQPARARGRRLPAFPPLEREQFDLVFLDPPPHSKSAFGVVDLMRDYQALFKPTLATVAEGGVLYCTNNVAAVDEGEWHELLRRCASKHGRPTRSLDVLAPGEDFPSGDGRPPLKVARLEF